MLKNSPLGKPAWSALEMLLFHDSVNRMDNKDSDEVELEAWVLLHVKTPRQTKRVFGGSREPCGFLLRNVNFCQKS
ncbi:hypothetical protein Tco_0356573 [Tanacetum coccineum]